MDDGLADVDTWSGSADVVDPRAVLDALPRAVIVTDAEGRIILWTRPAELLYGWAASEVVGKFVTEVLVPLEERARAAEIMQTVRAGARWTGDFTVLRRNGDPVRAFVVDTPIVDAQGAVVAIVGASEDVTDQRLLEQQAADLAAHLALALDAGELGTWRWDVSTGVATWDQRLEALYGLTPGSFAGTFDAYLSLVHPDDAPAVRAALQRAVAEKGRYAVEHRVMWPDGTVRWVQDKGRVILDRRGAVTGTMGCVMDVTERVEGAIARDEALHSARRAAEEQRVSAERLQLLGTVNEALAESFTAAEVTRNVPASLVPTLADWCALYVLPAHGSHPDVQITYSDPMTMPLVESYLAQHPYDPAAASGIPRVIRTGVAEFIADIDEAALAHDITDTQRQLVRDLGLRSTIAVPLVKHRRVLGALQLVNAHSGRRYTHDDLVLAEAIAGRVASALENRRLMDEQRRISATLQASLLPARLPTIEGVDLAVRYWPAGKQNLVGGDFYDVFALDQDRWGIVIGDVCGSGPGAAAITALARHTIRTAAWNGAQPRDVLWQLNRAILNSDHDTFCTALYCTLETADPIRLTVTAGGHPLPVLHRPGAGTAPVGAYGSALGAKADPTFTETQVELAPDDSVVMYTDGITDVRPPHALESDDATAIVRHAAQQAPTADVIADRLHEHIDAVLPFAQRDDDIAVLVLRVTPHSNRTAGAASQPLRRG